MSGKNKNPNRTMPLIVVTIIAGLIGIFGFLTESPTQPTDRYYFKNSGGAVMFDHKQHDENTESCGDCHHEVLFADERMPCSDCHDDDFDPADFSHDEFMDVESHTCITCHLTDENLKPQSCTSCHPDVQEAEQLNIPCMDCHDDDYETDLLTHDEMQEIEDHSCESCHNMQAVSNVFHQSCTRCHLIENQARFLTAERKVKCEACHLK